MKTFKKIQPYLINILIIITLFISILIISKTAPFGNNVLGISDAIAKYKPMLFNFIMSIKKGTIDVYSFNNGLGNPFLFNYVYYLISPLNLIALLFNKADHMFLSVIILKLIITTINVTYYVRQKNKSNLVSLIACLSYVFSSWFITFYYNIMWLDAFMIFPLFQLGLERLTNNKPLTYILTTSYLVLTSIHLCIPVIIYGLIYFLIVNFFYQEKALKEKFKTFILYLLSTLVSALILTGYIWLLIDLKKKMSLSLTTLESPETKLTNLNFIKSLFYGNISSKEITIPNLAMNSLILLSTLYTFINEEIKKKDKIFIALALCLSIVFLFIKQFDFMASYFHLNANIYSYTFIFNFLLVMLLIKNVNKIDLKKLYVVAIPLIVLLLISYKSMELKFFIINLVSIIIFTIIGFFYNKQKSLSIIAIILLIIETGLISFNLIPSHLTNEKYPINENYQTTKPSYRLNYLTEKNTYFNQNLYKNIDTTELFSPMSYRNVINTLSYLGCMTDYSTILCSNENELTSLLFNVKTNDQYLEKIYAVNKDIKKTILLYDNIKLTEEELIKNMTSIDNIFIKETLNGELKDDTYYFKTDHPYYIIEFQNDDDTIETYIQTYKEFYTDNAKMNKAIIYTLNEDKLQKIYEHLSKNQIKYTHYQDSFLEGTINVDENQMIFTSIPYDTSWEIKVDNKEVKPTKLLNSLIGIEVEPGEHKITMRYKPNYKIGLFISFTTLLITLIIAFYPKKKKI